MNDAVIKLDSVSKSYRLGQYAHSTFRESVYNYFKKIISRNDFTSKNEQELRALRDLSFELKRGEAIGIIGPNGAGKSTILKILAGVTNPSSGNVFKNGKIGALIELSAGFHPELTGRENIFLYGSIIGIKKSYIIERFDEIVEFSGLSAFLDTPIKRYSSGMYARLGFSVTAHLEPDILLIDEVLSVGDFTFQEKCINKMNEYKNSGVTIVFVSHNMDAIRKLCSRSILLDKGTAVKDGDTESVIDKYYEINSKNMKINNSEGAVEILGAGLTKTNNEEVISIQSGEKALFRLKMLVRKDISNASFCLFIRRTDGMVVFDVSSEQLNNKRYTVDKNSLVEIRYGLKVNLLKGLYYVGFNLFGSVGSGTLGHIEYVEKICSFLVKENISVQGIANLEPKCFVEVSKRGSEL